MLDEIMLLWFLLTALSLLFMVVELRTTPASPVLKWGFILLTAYLGPLGAFLYVLGCREPLPGLHERYVATRWRQVLGSTMHCVAGDGVGILTGAVVASVFQLDRVTDIALETPWDSPSDGAFFKLSSCVAWLVGHTSVRSPALSFRSCCP